MLVFVNHAATTEIYTLSLHDALPILYARNPTLSLLPASNEKLAVTYAALTALGPAFTIETDVIGDRKSTRLNSSHQIISYAVFCLKKKTSAARVERRRGVC